MRVKCEVVAARFETVEDLHPGTLNEATLTERQVLNLRSLNHDWLPDIIIHRPAHIRTRLGETVWVEIKGE